VGWCLGVGRIGSVIGPVVGGIIAALLYDVMILRRKDAAPA
jgi:AAHS family 4-hydroxybenzoate transporter-like MFS transporter